MIKLKLTNKLDLLVTCKKQILLFSSSRKGTVCSVQIFFFSLEVLVLGLQLLLLRDSQP